MCLAGYYHHFVRHFGVIAKPLTGLLLKKGVVFIWTVPHQEAFSALRHALTEAPILAVPDFRQTFCIKTDDNGIGIGTALMQGGHPLAFLSKAMGPRSHGLLMYENEFMVILIAVEHWRCYLQHAEFQISTDQKA